MLVYVLDYPEGHDLSHGTGSCQDYVLDTCTCAINLPNAWMVMSSKANYFFNIHEQIVISNRNYYSLFFLFHFFSTNWNQKTKTARRWMVHTTFIIEHTSFTECVYMILFTECYTHVLLLYMH